MAPGCTLKLFPLNNPTCVSHSALSPFDPDVCLNTKDSFYWLLAKALDTWAELNWSTPVRLVSLTPLVTCIQYTALLHILCVLRDCPVRKKPDSQLKSWLLLDLPFSDATCSVISVTTLLSAIPQAREQQSYGHRSLKTGWKKNQMLRGLPRECTWMRKAKFDSGELEKSAFGPDCSASACCCPSEPTPSIARSSCFSREMRNPDFFPWTLPVFKWWHSFKINGGKKTFCLDPSLCCGSVDYWWGARDQ